MLLFSLLFDIKSRPDFLYVHYWHIRDINIFSVQTFLPIFCRFSRFFSVEWTKSLALHAQANNTPHNRLKFILKGHSYFYTPTLTKYFFDFLTIINISWIFLESKFLKIRNVSSEIISTHCEMNRWIVGDRKLLRVACCNWRRCQDQFLFWPMGI